MTEDQIWNLSDEDLEKEFEAAKADEESPETDIEDEVQNEPEVEETEEDDIVDEEAEDEESEDLEQPEEDSDDDDSEEDEVEDETEEDSETEEGELDGEPEEEEEKTEDVEDKAEDEPQPVEMLKFKANGQDFEFTDAEVRSQFGRIFGQAMNYTQKMQAIKPWRKTIDAIEEAKLSHEDVNLMIDVLKGDEQAVAAMIKRTGVDALALDTETADSYQPNDYGRNETQLALKDVEDRISKDQEYAVTHNVLTKQWDDKSWNEMVKDPQLIEALHIDVKNGIYDKISPIAQKMKVYDGSRSSDLDYYKQAARQYYSDEAQRNEQAQAAESRKLARETKEAETAKINEIKANTAKRKSTTQAAKKRKAAAPTKSKAGTKKSIDYLDDSDEAFEEWYKNLQDSM